MSARQLLSQMGIMGLDNMCVEKLEELDPEEQQKLLNEFSEVNSTGSIRTPSKWIFSHARTILATKAKNGQGVPRTSTFTSSGETSPLPELPDVMVDAECSAKLEELEPDDRTQLINLFIDENAKEEVRNPSSWLFARARTTIVEKLGKGKSKGKGSNALAAVGGKHGAGNSLQLLRHTYGVDDQAMDKIAELEYRDQMSLIAAFQQTAMYETINDPSKWLFAKARTILSKGVSHALGGKGMPSMSYGWQGKGGGKGTKPFKGGNSGSGQMLQIAELPGVQLDAQCLEKLQELDHSEQMALIEEFQTTDRKSVV